MSVVDAVADYERQMHDYAWNAVVKSRARFNGHSLAYKPVVGRVGLAAMRTGMRFVNRVRPLKRKMLQAELRNRDHARSGEFTGETAGNRPA